MTNILLKSDTNNLIFFKKGITNNKFRKKFKNIKKKNLYIIKNFHSLINKKNLIKKNKLLNLYKNLNKNFIKWSFNKIKNKKNINFVNYKKSIYNQKSRWYFNNIKKNRLYVLWRLSSNYEERIKRVWFLFNLESRTKRKWILSNRKSLDLNINPSLNFIGAPGIAPLNFRKFKYFNNGYIHINNPLFDAKSSYWVFSKFLYHSNIENLEIWWKNQVNYPKIESLSNLDFSDFIITFKETPRNFFISLIDKSGNLIDYVSKGIYYQLNKQYQQKFFKNSKKFVYIAMLELLINRNKKLLRNNSVIFKFNRIINWIFFSQLRWHFKNFNRLFRVKGIINESPHSHNGCRLKRIKR